MEVLDSISIEEVSYGDAECGDESSGIHIARFT